MPRQGVRPLGSRQGRGQPLEISEPDSNMMKTGIKPYPTGRKLAVFLKHKGRVLNVLLSLIPSASWCLT